MIAYWIGPWLGVVLVDRWRRRGQDVTAARPEVRVPQPARCGRDGGRHGAVDLAVLQPDRVRRQARPSTTRTWVTSPSWSGSRWPPLVYIGHWRSCCPSTARRSDPPTRRCSRSRSRRPALGLAEGGVPVGGALFGADGTLLGRGHNRRVQDDDPSVHGETAAFKNAGRQRSYRGTTMATTLSPCWFCSRADPAVRHLAGRHRGGADVLRRARLARRERRRGRAARRPRVRRPDVPVHRGEARGVVRGHRRGLKPDGARAAGSMDRRDSVPHPSRRPQAAAPRGPQRRDPHRAQAGVDQDPGEDGPGVHRSCRRW